MPEPIISYSHVDLYQSAGLILKDVSFEINVGDFVYLIGKTGSGKSSLIKSMYADVPISAGNAKVCGYDLTKIKKKEIPYLRRKLGIVFQDFHLLADRTAAQNLEFVLKATGWENKVTMQHRMEEVLNEVGMLGKEFKMIHQLSGGEQQRVAIARALANDPPIILADEPTGNLDSKTGRRIVELLGSLAREGKTVIIATHSSEVAAAADMTLEMLDGNIVTGGVSG